MIVGVDHLALACGDLAQADRHLDAAGFRRRFVEPDLANDEEKRRFVETYAPRHAIALYELAGSVAIEATAYGASPHGRISPYQVLLAAPPPTVAPSPVELPWAPVWEAAFGCSAPRPGWWPALGAQFWYEGGVREGTPTIRGAMLAVGDLDLAARFWERVLGSGPVRAGAADGRPWAVFAIRAPLRHWSLELALAEDADGRHAHRLDDAGFPCLALLSSNVASDEERLRSAGAPESTGVFPIMINGKPLSVSILRGPAGELVELVQVNRSLAHR